MMELDEIPSVYVPVIEPVGQKQPQAAPRRQPTRVGWSESVEVPPDDPDARQSSRDASRPRFATQLSLPTSVNLPASPASELSVDNGSDAASVSPLRNGAANKGTPPAWDDSASLSASSLKSALSGSVIAGTSALRRGSEMRERIRANAKQLVERKRGSAQLARRLMRSQSLQQSGRAGSIGSASGSLPDWSFDPSAGEIGPVGASNPTAVSGRSEHDTDEFDEQIRHSIELGSKYAARGAREHGVLVPPEHVQNAFFFGRRDGGTTTSQLHRLPPLSVATCDPVVLAKAHFPNLSDRRAFADQLTVRFGDTAVSAPLSSGEVESGGVQRAIDLSRIEDALVGADLALFAARPPRDFSAFIARVGRHFITENNEGIRGVGDEIVTTHPLRVRSVNEADADPFSLVEYFPAAAAAVGLRSVKSVTRRLAVDVNRLEFEHHWLYAREECVAARLRHLYAEHTSAVEALLVAVRRCLTLRERLMLAEDEKSGSGTEYTTIKGDKRRFSAMERERNRVVLRDTIAEIDTKRVSALRVGALLEAASAELESIRRSNAANAPTTRIALHKILPQPLPPDTPSVMDLTGADSLMTLISELATASGTNSEDDGEADVDERAVRDCFHQLLNCATYALTEMTVPEQPTVSAGVAPATRRPSVASVLPLPPPQSTSAFSRTDAERLDVAARCRIQVEILFNGVSTAAIDEAPLRRDAAGFSVYFGRVHQLEVTEPAEQIAFVVRERMIRGGDAATAVGSSDWQELARVYLPPPDDDETEDGSGDEGGEEGGKGDSEAIEEPKDRPNRSRLLAMEFASAVVRPSFRNSIGCGQIGISPTLHGRLYCRAVWRKLRRPHCPGERKMSATHHRRMSAAASLSSVEDDDPHSTSDMLQLIPAAATLCTDDEFQAEVAQICVAREQSRRQRHAAPMLARSTTFDDTVSIFSMPLSYASQSVSQTPGVGQFPSGDADATRLDAMRRVGHAYAVMTRRQLCGTLDIASASDGLSTRQLRRRRVTYAQVVHEESVPTLFRTFGTLFTPPDLSRKLKPMRLPSTAAARAAAAAMGGGGSGGGGTVYRLIVNVQSATNLPQRVNGEPSNVFAEVTFQKSCARTTVAEGRHANWQETLTLDIDESTASATVSANPADPTGSSGSGGGVFDPRAVVDHIELNIYDQHVTQLDADDRQPRAAVVHEQIEWRWLAAARVPFAGVHALGKLDGAITLQLPLFLAGYRMPTSNFDKSAAAAVLQPTTAAVVATNASHRHAAVKLLITVDPPLAAAPLYDDDEDGEHREGGGSGDDATVAAAVEHLGGGEADSKVYAQALKWERRLRPAFPRRCFAAFATDTGGKRVLASRFLRAIAPPASVVAVGTTSREAAASACVDAVAAIPLVRDSSTFPGACNLWTTVSELLKIGCGDAVEHACLLACWLLGIGVRAAVVLGAAALPEGSRGAYVLADFENTDGGSGNRIWLINASDGSCYSPADPTVPFYGIGTVITPQNIYGYVQRRGNAAAHPSLIDFDFRKRSVWEPLFTTVSAITGTANSVQPPNVQYAPADDDLAAELRASLEREIKFQFDGVRLYAIPQWNLLASRTLRDILAEMWTSIPSSTGGGSALPNRVIAVGAPPPPLPPFVDAVERRIATALSGAYRVVNAVAFRCGYASRRDIVERVLRLRAHLDCQPNAQHALAVHVRPFTDRVVAVSVAIATLSPL